MLVRGAGYTRIDSLIVGDGLDLHADVWPTDRKSTSAEVFANESESVFQ